MTYGAATPTKSLTIARANLKPAHWFIVYPGKRGYPVAKAFLIKRYCGNAAYGRIYGVVFGVLYPGTSVGFGACPSGEQWDVFLDTFHYLLVEPFFFPHWSHYTSAHRCFTTR
jgi:hypothetical protein